MKLSKILVINCGSSSVKYALFEMRNEKKISWGTIECIGFPKACYKRQNINMNEEKSYINVSDHMSAVELIIKCLLNDKNGCITNINEIAVVGHRVAHGGTKFLKSVLVTDEVKKNLKKYFTIAPLHNPANYAGILAIEKMLPGTRSVLVFDTAFHQTIPDYAYMYAIPYEYYEKYNIRKYGFHGTSHNYVSQRASTIIGKNLNDLKLITAHLGNGSSIAAIKYGKVIDTSMGFTPLQGVIMGTRCGDIDTAIIPYIMKYYKQYKNNNIVNDLNILLNKKSGLLGISGVSADIRDIIKEAGLKNKRAKLAFEMLCYSVKKYISAYYGILNGIDGLVFTAGIGENSPLVRKKICDNLSSLGIEINSKKNNMKSNDERLISRINSDVKVIVIPTNEELMIAKESKACLNC